MFRVGSHEFFPKPQCEFCQRDFKIGETWNIRAGEKTSVVMFCDGCAPRYVQPSPDPIFESARIMGKAGSDRVDGIIFGLLNGESRDE